MAPRSQSEADPSLAGPFAEVRLLQGKTLAGSARGRSVLTDRPIAGGGNDLGFTSGELLLIAIGSCVIGSLNTILTESGEETGGLTASLRFDPPDADKSFGRIVVDVRIPGVACPEQRPELVAAAAAGRVMRRVRAGSEVVVKLAGDDGARAKPT